MRVIAGTAKGRSLRAVPGRGVRPTADRVREALFSILGSRFALEGLTVLDLFAGTGAVGIEALSRGAARAVFVERDAQARRVLRDNLVACGFAPRAEILAMPVQRAIEMLARTQAQFDGAFVDPPYGKGLAVTTLEALATVTLLLDEAWVVVEHHVADILAPRYGSFHLTQTRRYGKTSLTLFCGERLRRSTAVSS